MPNDTTPTTVEMPVRSLVNWMGPPESPWHASLRASGSYAHNWPRIRPLRRLGWLARWLYSIKVELHDGSISDVRLVLSKMPLRLLPEMDFYLLTSQSHHTIVSLTCRFNTAPASDEELSIWWHIRYIRTETGRLHIVVELNGWFHADQCNIIHFGSSIVFRMTNYILRSIGSDEKKLILLFIQETLSHFWHHIPQHFDRLLRHRRRLCAV